MQALLLYALFGMLMAALAGVVSFSVDTTQQFIQNQRAMTLQYFRNVEMILTEVVVPRNMEIPEYTSCPDGSTGAADEVGMYLCQREVAQMAEWAGSSGGVRDTWGHPFRGYVLRKLVPVYASSPNYNVVAPVTAMVLVSGGPDGRVDATLQANIDALSSSSALNDVMRIGAPASGTCTSNAATGVSCDDIVYTFSNQRALEQRWHAVEGAIDRIAGAALRNYQMQFRQFLPQLATIYKDNLSELFDANGNLVLNEETANIWQKEGAAGTPTMGSINLSSATARVQAGVDEEFRYITTPVAAGGSGISLTYTVGNSPYGLNDVLTISIANNGSPWGTGSNKTLSYRKEVYATAAP